MSRFIVLLLAVVIAGSSVGLSTAFAEDKVTAAKERKSVSDFALKDVKGKKVKLSKFKGKVVVVSFWATWCKPCLKELPQLDELHQKYNDKGLEILAISTDGPESIADVRSKLKKFKNLTVLLDTDGKAAQALNPEVANPYTVFIDRAGRLVKAHSGYAKGDEVEHEKLIKILLDES